MFHRAFAAFIAVHFSLYLSVVFGIGLAAAIFLLSDNSLLLSLAYAGEIVGGYWAVQGGFALMEAQKSKQRSRNRSID